MFVDEDGEKIARADLQYFLENFKVAYVNKKQPLGGDHKIYEYSFVENVLKISCSSCKDDKIELLYQSQMTYEIVENVVNNSIKVNSKEKNKFTSSSQDPLTQTTLSKMPEGVTFSELSKHNKPGDYWISVHRKVYDITHYFQRHPGGKIILKQSGNEATNIFNQYHPWINADYILKDHFIGNLKLI